ncbi:hypothetical protein [Bradyrhizobium sp. STM 3809]|uniref:hypothetical protein n=1 Tax=Bradyrhizobium sp. STM 3809 TaxID=551936 RepID=UPI0002408E2D|nr:hypothetical protein [Bradyrhizobium sp. STM 3809]CCE00921.1 hypothetical protein BRAS3809_3870002 [Bradyrhizobium sp. STM 3809]
MRNKASLHPVPIVPDPNFAGNLRGYREDWTVPTVEDLARNRRPLYLPGDDPARRNPQNSPWLPNYRNELEPAPDPQSSLREWMSDRQPRAASSATLKALMALSALGYASVGNGASGREPVVPASRPTSPAVLFGLGVSPQAPGLGDQTGSGGLLDLLSSLMSATRTDPPR